MTAPFTIDPATGRVQFPDLHLDLRPLMPHAEFINMFPWGKLWVLLDSKSGGTDIWIEFFTSGSDQ